MRRIEKNVNGAITRYVYDREDILLEYDGANNLIARYTHGTGIDEPLIMGRGGKSYYYHADGLGSITMLTDSGRNVVQSYVYDVFGNIVEKTGSLTNPYTYTGREYDPESGLYFYRARYYDPKIGRFLQEDPIGFLGGVNFYAYVGNNPVNLVDPFGWKEDKDDWLKTGLEAGKGLRWIGRVLTEGGLEGAGKVLGTLGWIMPGGTGKMAGGMALGMLGAKGGAVVGTYIFPGVGTFVGGVAGGIIFGHYGAEAGSYLDPPDAGIVY